MKLIGLVCPGKRHQVVPLKKVNVDVTINDFIASVVSTLEYDNDEDEAIEAEFVFPMDDDSAVYHFEVDIDGKTIIGECQEKKQAEETYQEAMSQGYRAFYMSEVNHTGDTFQMKIGNLPSKKKAVVKFCYVIKLKVSSDGGTEFTLPEVLNPRYNPKPQDGGAAVKTTPTFSSPQDIPYSLDFIATIQGSKMVQDVTSATPIAWDRDYSGNVKVLLKDGFKFDSDITLTVLYDNPHKPSVVARKGNQNADGILKQDIVMLNFFPEVKNEEMASNVEFIFVIDRSGSMRGDNMKHAKSTLLLFLKSLPVGCCFNIISFGSRYDVLFSEGSKDYNKESLAEATELQTTMDANMGGTELLPPLKYMYDNMKLKPGFCRQVFVLTDGGVSNTRAVIELVQEHAHDTRVFGFGIGHGASTALVKGISRVGKGKAEFVSGDERLQSKVVSNLRLAMQPSVMNVKVEWNVPNGVNIVNVPTEIPFIFSGVQMVAYGIVQGECPENVQLSAKLTAKCGNKDICETLSFQLQDSVDDSEYPLHRLAAKEQIKALEDKDSSPGADVESDVTEDVKHKILLLSTSTNIVSKYTAFVGVDKETREVKCHKRNVPVATTFHYQMVAKAACSGISVPACAPPMMISSKRKQMGSPTMKRAYHFSSQELPPPPGLSLGTGRGGRGGVAGFVPKGMDIGLEVADCMDTSTEEENATNSMEKLIDLQNFDGSWDFTESLANIIDQDSAKLKALDIKNDTVLATTLALIWLELYHSDKIDEWSIISAKAAQWLQTNNQEGKSVDQLKDMVKTVLKK